MDWAGYGGGLSERLVRVHEALQSGHYRARPVRRQWIAKSDGRQRPLGITCVEDKVVQQALVWILEAIYETDFLGFRKMDSVQAAVNMRRWMGCTWRLQPGKSVMCWMRILRPASIALSIRNCWRCWADGLRADGCCA